MRTNTEYLYGNTTRLDYSTQRTSLKTNAGAFIQWEHPANEYYTGNIFIEIILSFFVDVKSKWGWLTRLAAGSQRLSLRLKRPQPDQRRPPRGPSHPGRTPQSARLVMRRSSRPGRRSALGSILLSIVDISSSSPNFKPSCRITHFSRLFVSPSPPLPFPPSPPAGLLLAGPPPPPPVPAGWRAPSAGRSPDPAPAGSDWEYP